MLGKLTPPWRWQTFGDLLMLVTDAGGSRVVLAGSRQDGTLMVCDDTGRLVPLKPDHPIAAFIVEACNGWTMAKLTASEYAKAVAACAMFQSGGRWSSLMTVSERTTSDGPKALSDYAEKLERTLVELLKQVDDRAGPGGLVGNTPLCRAADDARKLLLGEE
jgi:hypothetical protein